MKNLYLYPVRSLSKTEINPYMTYLEKALQKHYNVLNAERPARFGIFEILKYLRRINIIYLNWIEELPGLNLGALQAIFFLLILRLFRLFGIKVIWTLHNKKSHWEKGSFLKNRIFRQMMKKSNLILTHAEEGMEYIGDRKAKAFLHHPVRVISSAKSNKADPEHDIIIWGNIAPYKGVDTFLEFLDERGLLENYRIVIAGKVSNDLLLNRINEFRSRSRNLVLINEFVPEDQLISLINRSKLVVFTYHSASVLSSGALMDSLSHSALIIGPRTGAFKDLAGLGLIDTFTDYEELLQKIELHLQPGGKSSGDQRSMIERFNHENSWQKFPDQLHRTLTEYLGN